MLRTRTRHENIVSSFIVTAATSVATAVARHGAGVDVRVVGVRSIIVGSNDVGGGGMTRWVDGQIHNVLLGVGKARIRAAVANSRSSRAVPGFR